MKFTIISWNVAGSRHLKKDRKKRKEARDHLNDQLRNIVSRHQPHVVTLQEVTRYGHSDSDAESIIKEIEGYQFYSYPIFDCKHMGAQAAWDEVRDGDDWDSNTFFAQENTILLRDDVPLTRILDLQASGTPAGELCKKGEDYIEPVRFESGLYFGDRDTEPRMALIVHILLTKDDKPLDIFVINTHLTTLRGEREGVFQIDAEGARIRKAQLEIIFYGIISRYSKWKQSGYQERGKPRKGKEGEEYDRHPPVFIVAGDFNLMPKSTSYDAILRMNFVDVIENTGIGTKKPNLTVDYIFAGPVFTSLDPTELTAGIVNNSVEHTKTMSDHFPLYADIPIVPPKKR